jgi:glutaminyl-peptide cyclotransferase
VILFRLSLTLLLLVAGPALAQVPTYGVTVVATYPHDPSAFTEGLFYRDGFLYESTGLQGQSSVRKVELATGKILQQHAIDKTYFGEGIVAWKDRLIELTWQDHIGFVYDIDTFQLRSTFPIEGEGWALTQDGQNLIMSDGSSDLRILDPNTLKEVRRLHVTCDGNPVSNINELEWVKGEIDANIWITNLIVRIAPDTGKVVGVIDLTPLSEMNPRQPPDKVPNGIAYDAVGDRLFVTGKLWASVYQVRLTPEAPIPGVCQQIH